MIKKNPLRYSRGLAATLIALSCWTLSGCTVTAPPNDNGSHHADRHEINTGAEAALSKLYATVPSSREMVRHAYGVLVFPSVFQAGLVVGGEYGRGALRVGDETQGYYNIAAGSLGWQIGAQSKAIVLLFMTPDALSRFRQSNGWEVGADATVAVATVGANGDVDSSVARNPMVAFVMTNAGLMAGVSLQGAKISHITP